MKKVAIFTGNRAEWGLLEPLAYTMKYNYDFDIRLIISGSHLSKQFGETIKYIPDDYAGYVTSILVDYDNNIGVTQSMGLGLIQFPSSLSNINPDCLIVLGDRYEALAVSIVAYNLGIPIAHIQGDDVTEGSLDDGYRRCIRELATYHFDVSEYGSLGCVFPELSKVPIDVLIAYHPDKNLNNKRISINISGALRLELGYEKQQWFNPNCDSGGRSLSDWTSKCHYMRNEPRRIYLNYLKSAKLIIGNSSSGIIEAPSLNTPTINIGNRQKGRIRAESVIDCDGTVDGIREAIVEAEKVKFPVNNPYYKPNTVQRIIEKLKETL